MSLSFAIVIPMPNGDTKEVACVADVLPAVGQNVTIDTKKPSMHRVNSVEYRLRLSKKAGKIVSRLVPVVTLE